MKTHHYIISFDPKDAVENGLTMERAQALGLQFCKDNFPGHPAIVCTHPDGHNHSGNIHVHIVIGSVRTREVERKPYMQKPRDWLEGMKHSSTAQTMRHLRVEVMELCEGAGLYQIDLLNGSKERVSEAEYWVRRRGQIKLDHENAALTAAGQPPRQKKFETVKVACRGEAPPFAAQTARSLKSPTGAFVASQTRTLRKQISSVLYRVTSFEDFSDKLMQQYGIAVNESRGQLSYLPAGRTKFIRAKHLGDKFDKAAVLATLQANTERKPKAQFKQDSIGKLLDIQSRMIEDKGIGYKRWLTKHNLKVMAQTVKLLQEKVFSGEVKFTNDKMIKLVQSSPDKRQDVFAEIMHPEITKAMEAADAEPNADNPVPMPTADPEQFKTYQVPDEFMRVYKTLSTATEMMKNTWKRVLKNNQSYLSDPEKQKVLRFAMQRPALYLNELEACMEQILAETLEEAEKTA